MKAILMPGDRVTKIVEKAMPEPNPDQIILKNRAAGLCGSDLHLFYRPPASERNGIMFGLQLNSKIIPGHEGAGEVSKVGSNVKHLKVGDRVAVAHISGCGNCISCRRGWDVHCKNKTTYALDRDGFLSDYTLVDARDCVTLPPNISFEEGAFWACGAGTAWSAINRLNLPAGSILGVVGLGPVGAAAVLIASSLGLRVIGFDPVAERREFAMSLGAEKCYDPTKREELSEVIDELDGTFEASGSSAGRNLCLDLLKVWGRSSFVGFADDETTFDIHMQIIEKQIQLNGVWLFSTPDLQEFINRASESGLTLEPLFTHRYSISQGVEALIEFDKGSAGKTMICW